MNPRFKNRVAVVTGGARGIGAATARLLLAEGAGVVVADVLEECAVPDALYLRTDVTDAAAVERLFAAVEEQCGGLDVLIANAGRPYGRTTLNATGEDWQECLDLNLKSAWLCARAAHPLLVRSNAAAIVTVASAQGRQGTKNSFPYSAAKGGLLAMTRSMAVEYAPRIRVNAVIPGQIESVRTETYFNSFRDPAEAIRRVLRSYPMGRLGKPEDVARAIVFLASSDACWITGAFLTVDGGREAAMLDLSDLRKE